jgi:glycosyltransferase involved in cell wall biosynthesis
MDLNNAKVSVIIPYVNEWPQIAFTIRAVAEELIDETNFEIIVIDNFCHEVFAQGALPDRGHDRWIEKNTKKVVDYRKPEGPGDYELAEGHLKAIAKQSKWLKYVKYDAKLSHWNAKNIGVLLSTGSILLFLDAHVVPSKNLLKRAFISFKIMMENGGIFDTLHLPLTYHILEDKRLAYKLIYQPDSGVVHYSFTSFNSLKEYTLEEVPCMSTCGMFMSRALYDALLGWPDGLGIYGGGENYINFVLAVIGSKKFVYPMGALHHHGDKRSYHFNWRDYHRNRLLATCIFAGFDFAERYKRSLGNNFETDQMLAEARVMATVYRENVEKMQKMEISEWAKKWGF